MLLLVIALVWLTVVTVVVAVCQAAARGDALPARGEELREEPICDGLVAWDQATAALLRDEWLAERVQRARARTARPAQAGTRARRVASKQPR